MNTLVWGWKSWVIKESSFNDMDVFLHSSVRKIPCTRWDDQISNEEIREKFYNLQDIGRMVVARQLLFVGKVVRRENEFIPKQLMTAWVNNKRKRVRHITTNKTSIAKCLQQLYPPNV